MGLLLHHKQPNYTTAKCIEPINNWLINQITIPIIITLDILHSITVINLKVEMVAGTVAAFAEQRL